MKHLFALGLAFLLSPAIASSPPEAWTPKVEFSLEGASFQETLHWVSGWTYAMTELGKATRGQPGALLCLPSHGYVESRVLLDILNNKFKAETITSEQAAETLWMGAIAHYRCQQPAR